jgi:tRNA uridine 5-carboxymethylaminomethyl modification enzyme
VAGLEPVEELAEVALKYEGYLAREQELVAQMQSLERYRVPDGFDYGAVTAISHEAREKLAKIRPDTLGQASRISGVSPADIAALMVLLKRWRLPAGDGTTAEVEPPSGVEVRSPSGVEVWSPSGVEVRSPSGVEG